MSAPSPVHIIVWVEIPFISVLSKDPAAHENCVSQMKKLIIQNYNLFYFILFYYPAIWCGGVSAIDGERITKFLPSLTHIQTHTPKRADGNNGRGYSKEQPLPG